MSVELPEVFQYLYDLFQIRSISLYPHRPHLTTNKKKSYVFLLVIKNSKLFYLWEAKLFLSDIYIIYLFYLFKKCILYIIHSDEVVTRIHFSINIFKYMYFYQFIEHSMFNGNSIINLDES